MSDDQTPETQENKTPDTPQDQEAGTNETTETPAEDKTTLEDTNILTAIVDAQELKERAAGRLEAALADIAEARNTADKQLADAKKAATEKLAKDFLIAVKELDEGMDVYSPENVAEDVRPIVDGLVMIQKGIDKTAENFGFNKVEIQASAPSQSVDEDVSSDADESVKDEAPAETTEDKAEKAAPVKKATKKAPPKFGKLKMPNGPLKPNAFAGVDALIEEVKTQVETLRELSKPQDNDDPELSDVKKGASVLIEELEEIGTKLKAANDEKNGKQARKAREIEDAKQFGAKKLAEAFITEVMDNIEFSLMACEKSTDNETVKEIKAMVEKAQGKLVEAFNANGIDVDRPEGEKFDPNKHEAVTMQAIPGKESNTVAMVASTGYTLNNRIIRAAKVVVAK